MKHNSGQISTPFFSQEQIDWLNNLKELLYKKDVYPDQNYAVNYFIESLIVESSDVKKENDSIDDCDYNNTMNAIEGVIDMWHMGVIERYVAALKAGRFSNEESVFPFTGHQNPDKWKPNPELYSRDGMLNDNILEFFTWLGKQGYAFEMGDFWKKGNNLMTIPALYSIYCVNK
jgi:hypothetical protein